MEEIQKRRHEALGGLKATDLEWKDWKSVNADIGIKWVQLDEYGRKIVYVKMLCDRFSWTVNTVCFNIITEVLNTNEEDINMM